MADAVNWSAAATFVDRSDVNGFVAWTSNLIHDKTAHFKTLERGLKLATFDKVEPSKAVAFLTDCADQLLHSELDKQPQHTSAVLHLVLELVPTYVRLLSPGELAVVQQKADMLMECCYAAERARLVVKLASGYRLKSNQLRNLPILVSFIRSQLKDSTTYSPAVSLIMYFKDLEDFFDVDDVVAKLVSAGQEGIADSWVSTLGRERQVMFVEQCILFERLKCGVQAVRRYKLHEDFPDIERMYTRHCMASMMDKAMWPMAALMAGEDRELQEVLVLGMLARREGAAAEEMRQHFGLPQDLVLMTEQEMAAEVQRHRETYIQLDLPEERVLVVDTLEKLEAGMKLLGDSDIIGIDAEWKPVTDNGAAAPASILQVASRSAVVIFDLLVLNREQQLDSCLLGLLTSAHILKLGFDVVNDVRKLRSSYPHVNAFKQDILPMLDLKNAVKIEDVASLLPSRKDVGLSKLCAAVLGKKMDKSMQTCNWEARPLTSRQIRYAGLDALVLVQLYDAISSQYPTSTQRLHDMTQCSTTSCPPRGRSSADVSTATPCEPASSTGPMDSEAGSGESRPSCSAR